MQYFVCVYCRRAQNASLPIFRMYITRLIHKHTSVLGTNLEAVCVWFIIFFFTRRPPLYRCYLTRCGQSDWVCGVEWGFKWVWVDGGRGGEFMVEFCISFIHLLSLPFITFTFVPHSACFLPQVGGNSLLVYTLPLKQPLKELWSSSLIPPNYCHKANYL